MRRRILKLAGAGLLLLTGCIGSPAASQTPTAPASPSAPVAGQHPIYAAGSPGSMVLWEAPGEAESRRLGALPGNVGALATSPNGRLLAMVLGGSSDQLVLRDLTSGVDRVLLQTNGGEHLAMDLQWRPDGSALAVSSTPPETAPGAPSTMARLLLLPADGSGPRQLLASGTDAFFVSGWSSNGSLLFFGRARYRTDDPGSLWSIKADGSQLRDLQAPRAFSDVVSDGSAVVYVPFRMGAGVGAELWEMVPGQDRHRIVQIPGLSDLRLLPSSQSILVVLQSEDGKTVRFARVARNSGAVTPLGASFTTESPVFARFAPSRVVAPSGDGAVVTLDGRTGQAESLLWIDLTHDRTRLLATAPIALPAGWR